MSTFKDRLLNEPIRAIIRADGTFIQSSECYRMMYDEETNGVWYILDTTKEVIPMI